MNRTHVVPACNVTEAEAKEGLAALDVALSVADEHTRLSGTSELRASPAVAPAPACPEPGTPASSA